MKCTDNQLNKEFGELNSQTQSVYNSLVEDTTAKDNTGAKSIFGDIEAAWSDVTGFAQKHEKALIIAGAAIALIAVGIATCGVGDAVLAPALAAALGMGAIGAGTGLAGEEISDYMDDGKIDNTDQSYLGTAAGGFVKGALCPVGGTEALTVKGIAMTAGKNALGSMVGNAAGQEISTGKINYEQVAETGLFAGALSGVSTVAVGALKSSVINTVNDGVAEASQGSSKITGNLVPANDGIKETLVKAGLNQEKTDEIISLSKSEKPIPETYLSQDYINAHLQSFKDSGIVKIMAEARGGTFVMSGDELNSIIEASNGDVSHIENSLGFDKGYLGNNPVICKLDSYSGLRMPQGNELGAIPEYWMPGGYTSGGIKEAVIDPAKEGTLLEIHSKTRFYSKGKIEVYECGVRGLWRGHFFQRVGGVSR